jgi:hypothetical protein
VRQTASGVAFTGTTATCVPFSRTEESERSRKSRHGGYTIAVTATRRLPLLPGADVAHHYQYAPRKQRHVHPSVAI